MERRVCCDVIVKERGQQHGVSQGGIRKRNRDRSDIVDKLDKRRKATSAKRECETVVSEDRAVPQAGTDRYVTFSEVKPYDHQGDELEDEFISEHSLASEQVEKVSEIVRPDTPASVTSEDLATKVDAQQRSRRARKGVEQGRRKQGTRKYLSPAVGDVQTGKEIRSKNHQGAGASEIEPVQILETQKPYYVGCKNDILPCVEDQLREVSAHQRGVQVPSWREDKNPYNLRVQTKIWKIKIKSTNPCYSVEGTEDLGDQVLLKRHEKMEKEEKQRKKWDMQRIRQEQQVKKLLARQEKQHASQTTSLFPSLEAATHICLDDNIPVAAFGRPIPSLPRTMFSLPWLKDSSAKSRL